MAEDFNNTVVFTLGGINFEYDEEKNRNNIKKHGISFRNAARVFFDYDRIELYDEDHSDMEDRFNTIGDVSSGQVFTPKTTTSRTAIGNVEQFTQNMTDILFVVYTERIHMHNNHEKTDRIRIISARLATSFERGLYYGKID